MEIRLIRYAARLNFSYLGNFINMNAIELVSRPAFVDRTGAAGVADATVRGGALRMLTVLDEHTRECHVLRVDRALKLSPVT